MAIPKLDKLLASVIHILELSIDFQRRAPVSYQRQYILGLCINVKANGLLARGSYAKVWVTKGGVHTTGEGTRCIGTNRSRIGAGTVVRIYARRALVDVLTRVIDHRVSAQALADVVDATSPDTLRIFITVIRSGTWIVVVCCLSWHVGDRRWVSEGKGHS